MDDAENRTDATRPEPWMSGFDTLSEQIAEVRTELVQFRAEMRASVSNFRSDIATLTNSMSHYTLHVEKMLHSFTSRVDAIEKRLPPPQAA